MQEIKCLMLKTVPGGGPPDPPSNMCPQNLHPDAPLLQTKWCACVIALALKECSELCITLWLIMNNLRHLFTFTNEEQDLTEGGNDCAEKRRHLFDSESYLPWVIRVETPSGLFFLFFLSVEEKEKGGAREGGHRWPFGLSVGCLGAMSGREGGRER